jgi:hypothetical protein
VRTPCEHVRVQRCHFRSRSACECGRERAYFPVFMELHESPLRLLQHHLRDEDRVRIRGPAPGRSRPFWLNHASRSSSIARSLRRRLAADGRPALSRIASRRCAGTRRGGRSCEARTVLRATVRRPALSILDRSRRICADRNTFRHTRRALDLPQSASPVFRPDAALLSLAFRTPELKSRFSTATGAGAWNDAALLFAPAVHRSAAGRDCG